METLAKMRSRSLAAFGKRIALLPGIAVCALITLVALGAQSFEVLTFGHPYVEALVLAILLGTAVRSVWDPA